MSKLDPEKRRPFPISTQTKYYWKDTQQASGTEKFYPPEKLCAEKSPEGAKATQRTNNRLRAPDVLLRQLNYHCPTTTFSLTCQFRACPLLLRLRPFNWRRMPDRTLDLTLDRNAADRTGVCFARWASGDWRRRRVFLPHCCRSLLRAIHVLRGRRVWRKVNSLRDYGGRRCTSSANLRCRQILVFFLGNVQLFRSAARSIFVYDQRRVARVFDEARRWRGLAARLSLAARIRFLGRALKTAIFWMESRCGGVRSRDALSTCVLVLLRLAAEKLYLQLGFRSRVSGRVVKFWRIDWGLGWPWLAFDKLAARFHVCRLGTRDGSFKSAEHGGPGVLQDGLSWRQRRKTTIVDGDRVHRGHSARWEFLDERIVLQRVPGCATGRRRPSSLQETELTGVEGVATGTRGVQNVGWYFDREGENRGGRRRCRRNDELRLPGICRRRGRKRRGRSEGTRALRGSDWEHGHHQGLLLVAAPGRTRKHLRVQVGGRVDVRVEGGHGLGGWTLGWGGAQRLLTEADLPRRCEPRSSGALSLLRRQVHGAGRILRDGRVAREAPGLRSETWRRDGNARAKVRGAQC